MYMYVAETQITRGSKETEKKHTSVGFYTALERQSIEGHSGPHEVTVMSSTQRI